MCIAGLPALHQPRQRLQPQRRLLLRLLQPAGADGRAGEGECKREPGETGCVCHTGASVPLGEPATAGVTLELHSSGKNTQEIGKWN